MKKNMGYIDRVIRVIFAVAVAILFFNGVITGTFGIVLMVLAIVFVLTSMLGFCPIYTVLGINTTPAKKAQH